MRRRTLAWGLAALSLSGCGLISSNVDDFQLSLPEKEFAVDTTSWGLPTGTTVPDPGSCSSDDFCAAAAALCSAGDCAGTCSTESKCQLDATVSLWRTVDMATERPELKTIDNQAGVRVTIKTIDFTIDENTLNVATPVLKIYVGPESATTTDPPAVWVGHIDPLPPKSTTTADIKFDNGGDAVMSQYFSDYTTPFHIIVAGDLVVKAGDLLPEGRVSGRITGTAVADAL